MTIYVDLRIHTIVVLRELPHVLYFTASSNVAKLSTWLKDDYKAHFLVKSLFNMD